MEKLTTKLISDEISEKIKSGEISLGIRKNITDFILTDFNYKDNILGKDTNKINVFCVCEYIEDNSRYTKAFEITI
jgi:hypothetical protein